MNSSKNSPYFNLMQLVRNQNPIRVSIELTSKCNAICQYCFAKDENSQDLSTQQIFTILDKLAESGVCFITFTGGEPFLREDISEIIVYAVKKQFWSISFLTNGTLISAEHIKIFKTYASIVRYFQFSIFSIKPSIHDRYVGLKGACQRILENAQKLKKNGITVTFALNALDSNKATLEETYDQLSQQYKVSIGLHRFVNPAIDSPEIRSCHTICSESYYDQLIPFLPKKLFQTELKRLKMCLSRPIDLNLSKTCSGIYNSFHINSQGLLFPCVTFRYLPIGSIFEKASLREIFNNSEQLKMLKKIQGKDINSCVQCRYFNACTFCMGQNHTLYGSVFRNNAQACNYIKSITRTKEFKQDSNIQNAPDIVYKEN